MEIIRVNTPRGLELKGAMWGDNTMNTVVIIMSGICSNVFQNDLLPATGELLSANNIACIAGHAMDAFSMIAYSDLKNHTQLYTGVVFDDFSLVFEDVESYVKYAKELGFKNIILAGHSLGSNKIINYLAVEKDCNVTFVDMKDCFKDLVMTHDFISYPTYFRLLVCDLLPDYDKCIYLDIDTIVLEDLSLFYAQDIEDFYLAGVRAAGYQFNAVHNIRRLGLPDVSDYINAGVLLMNLKKLRQDTMSKKFLDLIKEKYHDQDQDILNVACYGKIKVSK